MRQFQQWPTTRVTLLDRLRDTRDDESWQRFVDLYLPLIYQYALRHGLQESDAEDVAQDAMMQVYRSLATFEYDPDRGRFRNWLRLITRQRILRFRLGERSAVRGLGDGKGDELGDELESNRDSLWQTLMISSIYRCASNIAKSEFAPEFWFVYEQVWEQDKLPHEVAQQLGRKPEWVYYAKFRVLARIKQLVTELADDPCVDADVESPEV